MMRLTVELKPHVAEKLDSVVRADWNEEPEDWTRCAVLVNLLLERARQLAEGGHREAGAQQARQPHRDDLESVRRERDGLRKALEAERATRRRDRERYASIHETLRNARAAVARLGESRARYRDLAFARRGRGASRPGARRSRRPPRPPPPRPARCGLRASRSRHSGPVRGGLPRTALRRFAAETPQDVLSHNRRTPKPRLVPTG